MTIKKILKEQEKPTSGHECRAQSELTIKISTVQTQKEIKILNGFFKYLTNSVFDRLISKPF